MNLIINIASVYKGGAEQVAISFINECKKFKHHYYHIFLRENIESQLKIEEFPNNFKFYLINIRPGSSIKNLITALSYFNQLEKRIRPDCVIATGGNGYWKPKTAPIVGGFNIAHYIYPQSPYFLTMSFKKRLYWKFMKTVHMFFYRRLNAVIVQTDDVNQRLRPMLAENVKIHTVANTINGHFLNPTTFPLKLGERKSNEIRLLTLSAYYPHKNLEIIKHILEYLKSKHLNHYKFIVTLSSEQYHKVFGTYTSRMLINVGPTPISECPSLYRECDFMFLPTLLECFSASYAEAMAMRKPIITSDLGFAHTVCKKAAIYFKPLDYKDAADKIIRLSRETELQEKLRQEGENLIRKINTAEERAEKFLKICEETIKQWKK